MVTLDRLLNDMILGGLSNSTFAGLTSLKTLYACAWLCMAVSV